MKGEENHDPWLNLSLSPPQPRPAPPEAQPRPPVYLPIQQPNQGMVFPAPIPSYQHHLPVPVPIPSHQHHLPAPVPMRFHQHHHNTNEDQPRLSLQVRVPGVVNLQDNQHQTDQHQTAMMTTTEAAPATGPSRQPPRRVPRRQPLELLRPGKTMDIPPPYPWATCRRAHVQNLQELLLKGIRLIKGQVQCKHCEKNYSIEFDLQGKFTEVTEYILRYNYEDDMHQRAPDVWKNPVLPKCRECGRENSARPVIGKKRTTNWLFLLLGQMLGCCTLRHLKYFCKHTFNHRTGAKDRLLFQTYMGLCKQLDPNGPFDNKLDNSHTLALPSDASGSY